MFNRMHIPLVAFLISLFFSVTILGALEEASLADQSTTNEGKILKKEQRNQRRMDKRKKERKAAASLVAVAYHAAAIGPIGSQNLT